MKRYKRVRQLSSLDQETGEILDGVVVYCAVKHNPYSGGWVMNSQEALELLATDRDLKGEAYKVLLLLLSRLDFENWIQLSQTEIAEKLDMKKPNVSRAVSLLESKGILLRGPKSWSFLRFSIESLLRLEGQSEEPRGLPKARKRF